MGLDMYLYKDIYVGANFEHRNVKGTIYLTQDGKPIPIDVSRLSRVREVVAYWRKANAIHAWFVENVQNGVDDCGEYYVSKDKLKSLLKTVEEALANPEKADKVLPTQSGFFFGSTSYDSWYWEDLNDTAEVLSKILADESFDDVYVTLVYHSSW